MLKPKMSEKMSAWIEMNKKRITPEQSREMGAMMCKETQQRWIKAWDAEDTETLDSITALYLKVKGI